MKGYKAYEKGMICKGFQYEVGKEYVHDGELSLCESGFHFCENPLDILNYYDLCESEFTEVEALGKVTEAREGDTKRATDKIKIGRKLDLPAFIKASFEFLWEKCNKKEKSDENGSQLASSGYNSQLASSGDYSQLASSGDSSKLASSGRSSQLASSGDYSQLASSGDSSKLASSGRSSQLASSGDYSQLASSGYNSKLASSGYNSKLASSGYNSQLASSGDYSQLASSGYNSQLAMNGDDSVGACVGIHGRIKGKKGCWITLAEWRLDYSKSRFVPVCVKTAQIDGEVLKENTWYTLENGEFVECE
jgi:hypothetical protein